MQELLRYPGVIYDANCIVYFCFKIRDNDTLGHPVTVVGPHTYRARTITDRLVNNKKNVTTLRRAFEEAEKVLSGQALQSLINEGYIQEKLRITTSVSPALKLRLAQALRAEIEQMKQQKWFVVNPFLPAGGRADAVKEVYRKFCLNPAYHNRIPQHKGCPSDVDIALILYSQESTTPLLTNDREVFNFATELKAYGFCELIKAFRDVRLN